MTANGTLENKMKLLTTFFTLFFSALVVADSWIPPQRNSAISPDGKFVVWVEPSNSEREQTALATLLKFDGTSYIEHLSFRLKNKVAPTKVVLSNNGYLFTFDNWFQSGVGLHVAAIYDLNGELVKSYKLEELYSKTDYEKVVKNRSASSIWWRCFNSTPWANHDEVLVRDTIGGSFRFREKGDFTYETSGGCQGWH